MRKIVENISNKKRLIAKKFIFLIIIILTISISLCITNKNTIELIKQEINNIGKSLQEDEEINSNNSIKRVYITSSRDKVSIKQDDYAMLEVHVVTNDDQDLENYGTINYFQSSTDGGSIEIHDNIIKGINVGTVQLYITVEYNGEIHTSNTMEIIVQDEYEIEYSKVTLYNYDADTLFTYGGSVTDIENQGIYFTAGGVDETLGGVNFVTSDWNRWTQNSSVSDKNKPYTGLVQNELDSNGKIQFTKEDYGIFENTPSEGKEVYTNVGLPFVKQGNGFYIFDSSKYETYFPNGQASSDVNLNWTEGKVTYAEGRERLFSF